MTAASTAPTIVYAQENAGAFGSSEKQSASLIGIFYDLKQNQQREPVHVDYMQVVGEFLDSGWDENVLSKFFRVTRPVYATEVLIPNMGAGGAPTAFGVEGVVRPSQWVVIYKGQVSPPEDGTYRFVGVADDVLAVAVNGDTVLISNFAKQGTGSKWKPPEPQSAIPGGAYTMNRGDWFSVRKGEIIDLDILVGEFPGTAFGAWLLIEKKGENYPVVKHSKFGQRPVLPAFQVAPHDVSSEGQPVPFSTGAQPWTAVQ